MPHGAWKNQMSNQFIYDTKAIRELENLVYEASDVTGDMLMQRAGRAAFEYIVERFPNLKTMAVFCGAGNNGGDGYVVAKLAKTYGIAVTIYQVSDHSKLKNEAANAMLAAVDAKVAMQSSESANLNDADIVIDAICGIGLSSDLKGAAKDAVALINACSKPVVAIDIPTGIDADTGRVCGVAVKADVTITFIGKKHGLLCGDGASNAGTIVLNTLDVPADFFAKVSPVTDVIDFNDFVKHLTPRLKNWHKGLSGHVLVIGGDVGYSGAPHMASEAALRVGAGLVSVATHPENTNAIHMNRPEIMAHGITKPDQLKTLMEKASVIVLGPGLGQSEWSEAMWQVGVATDKPLLIDADGLNMLARQPSRSDRWVLTPHPGEAGRLLGLQTRDIQADRLAALRAIEEKYAGVCVLKGAGTLVGESGSLPSLCNKGNPGMATAGMGDVLSGVIGGLMAQHVPNLDAAKLGVYLHAVAGDMAAKNGQRGTIATDLMPYLRHLVNLG